MEKARDLVVNIVLLLMKMIEFDYNKVPNETIPIFVPVKNIKNKKVVLRAYCLIKKIKSFIQDKIVDQLPLFDRIIINAFYNYVTGKSIYKFSVSDIMKAIPPKILTSIEYIFTMLHSDLHITKEMLSLYDFNRICYIVPNSIIDKGLLSNMRQDITSFLRIWCYYNDQKIENSRLWNYISFIDRYYSHGSKELTNKILRIEIDPNFLYVGNLESIRHAYNTTNDKFLRLSIICKNLHILDLLSLNKFKLIEDFSDIIEISGKSELVEILEKFKKNSISTRELTWKISREHLGKVIKYLNKELYQKLCGDEQIQFTN